jgi:hypothetical protein
LAFSTFFCEKKVALYSSLTYQQKEKKWSLFLLPLLSLACKESSKESSAVFLADPPGIRRLKNINLIRPCGPNLRTLYFFMRTSCGGFPGRAPLAGRPSVGTQCGPICLG